MTTATDVYSLGLLLQLLLTGFNPRTKADVRSLSQLRALAGMEPARLSNIMANEQDLTGLAELRSMPEVELLRIFRGDLDIIVRKALAVEPEERYATVADFSQDLERYLRHDPVTAQAPTIRYRARKFVRRHRGGVLAASLMTVALIGAAVVTSWQSVVARQQRDAAIYQQQRVQASNEFLTLLLDEIGPQGRPLTMTELLAHGVTVLDRQYGTQQRFVGATYYDIAERYSGIGETSEALALYERAETVARAEDDDALLAASLCAQARDEYRSNPDIARAKVVEGSRLLKAARASVAEATISCARANAIILEIDNDPLAALDVLTATYADYSRQSFPSAHMQGVLLNDIGNMYYKMGRLDLALVNSDEIIELHRKTGREDSLGNLIVSLNRAVLLHTMGEIESAFEVRARLLPRLEELEAQGLAPAAFQLGYASSLIRLARYDEALAILYPYRTVLQNSGDEARLSQVDMQIAGALVFKGNAAEAEPYLDAAEKFMHRAPNTNRRTLQTLALYRTRLNLARGDLEAARQTINAELAAAGIPEGVPDAALDSVAPVLLRALVMVDLAEADYEKAEQAATTLHDTTVSLARDPAKSADVGQALIFRARARRASGNVQGAREDAQLALPALLNGLGAKHPDTREAEALSDPGPSP